jgi:hypothetical protein
VEISGITLALAFHAASVMKLSKFFVYSSFSLSQWRSQEGGGRGEEINLKFRP